MPLSYNLDLYDGYIWKIHTPNILTKQMPFYINEIGVFRCKDGFYTRRSKQRDFEILYTVNGLGEIQYKDKTYLLEKNLVFILDCYHLHHYKTVAGHEWTFKWLHFNGISAELYYNQIVENSNIICFESIENIDFHYNLLLNLSYGNNMVTSFSACKHLQNILTELYITSHDNRMRTEKFLKYNRDIQKVIRFIKENYEGTINLDDLCKLIHLSKYYFIGIFHKYTGSTPYEYLVNYRMSKAKELLRSTNLTIKEISQKVGFKDESNFTKTFKKINGITPFKYRCMDSRQL